jgi:hypothetical protein
MIFMRVILYIHVMYIFSQNVYFIYVGKRILKYSHSWKLCKTTSHSIYNTLFLLPLEKDAISSTIILLSLLFKYNNKSL